MEYYCTEHAQNLSASVIISFAYGVALSPWSSGIFWLIVTIILFEIIGYILGRHKCWDIIWRAGVIAAAILGWVTGRVLVDHNDIMCPGSIPFKPERDIDNEDDPI
jgi:hypothetical protein